MDLIVVMLPWRRYFKTAIGGAFDGIIRGAISSWFAQQQERQALAAALAG
jgi:hypothetical protein